MSGTVQGMKNVEAAIKAHTKATAKGVRIGLYRAGLFLQRESQKVVPVDTGALKGSATTRAEGEGLDTAVIVGYGTDYGLYVHENLDARHKPGKYAKFLTRTLVLKKDRMRQIVTDAIEDQLP